MTNMKIAFDIDNTIIIKNNEGRDVPNYKVINILVALSSYAQIILWSGSGEDYARMWADKLGISEIVTVIKKEKRDDIDVAFDDQVVDLAKVNINVTV